MIFAGGNGVRAPLLAASSFYISASTQTGRMYTILSMTDAFSHMVGDLIVQSIWSAALAMEDGWLMLPYLFMTVSGKKLAVYIAAAEQYISHFSQERFSPRSYYPHATKTK